MHVYRSLSLSLNLLVLASRVRSCSEYVCEWYNLFLFCNSWKLQLKPLKPHPDLSLSLSHTYSLPLRVLRPCLTVFVFVCVRKKEKEKEMALEAVIFQQDPFIYGCKDYSYNMAGAELAYGVGVVAASNGEEGSSSAAHSSPESWVAKPVVRKRRRTKPMKNKQEMESQRMTHIAVERNRRRQMNDYLAVLRSLMPPSYAQRVFIYLIYPNIINYILYFPGSVYSF